jgi:hypothetical protein
MEESRTAQRLWIGQMIEEKKEKKPKEKRIGSKRDRHAGNNNTEVRLRSQTLVYTFAP